MIHLRMIFFPSVPGWSDCSVWLRNVRETWGSMRRLWWIWVVASMTRLRGWMWCTHLKPSATPTLWTEDWSLWRRRSGDCFMTARLYRMPVTRRLNSYTGGQGGFTWYVTGGSHFNIDETRVSIFWILLNVLLENIRYKTITKEWKYCSLCWGLL